MKAFAAVFILLISNILDDDDAHLAVEPHSLHQLSLGQSQQWKGGEIMTLEEQRTKAERVAQKARDLGFRGVGFLVRDSYGNSIFAEAKLGELLDQYRPGDLVSIDTLLSLGRSKVKVQEA